MVNLWGPDRARLQIEGHRLEAAQIDISLGTLARLGQVNILPFSRDLCAKVGTLIRSPIFSTQLSVPALNLLTRAANCAWFCPPPSNRPVAWRALIETQRQAKTPLQLLCLPNAPFVKAIAFRALTGLRSAARERWLEDPKRRTR
jgi:hypothetical protein